MPSYQVGMACYEGSAAAYAALCAAQAPSWNYSATAAVLYECSGASSSTGYTLKRTTINLAVTPNTSTVSLVEVSPVLAPCQIADYVNGALLIFGAVLLLWVAYWPILKIISYLRFSRGSSET